jgi:hypothetical protein
MAVTKTTAFTSLFDNSRVRCVRLAFGTTDTSTTVDSGQDMFVPIGGYTDCTRSGNTFTMVVVGATSAYANTLFVGS